MLTFMFSLYCIRLLIYNMVPTIKTPQVIVLLPGKTFSFSLSQCFFKHVWKEHVPHFRAGSQKPSRRLCDIIVGVFLSSTPRSCSAHLLRVCTEHTESSRSIEHRHWCLFWICAVAEIGITDASDLRWIDQESKRCVLRPPFQAMAPFNVDCVQWHP